MTAPLLQSLGELADAKKHMEKDPDEHKSERDSGLVRQPALGPFLTLPQGIALATFGGSLYILSLNPKILRS